MAHFRFQGSLAVVGIFVAVAAQAVGCGTAPYQPPGKESFVVLAPPVDPSANELADAFGDDSDSTIPAIPVPPAPEPPPPPAPATAAGSVDDGGACNEAAECKSGTCEGKGCGLNEGRCAPKERRCTRDLRVYCGCDGKEFRGSGTCPGQRYDKQAACGS